MNDQHVANQNITTSIPVWRVKNFMRHILGFNAFGSEAGTLTWDEQSKTLRFLDKNGTATLTADVHRINKYYFSSNGNYTIWIDNTPIYFGIRHASLGGGAEKVATIANEFLEESFTSYADYKSAIMELKKFIDSNNPSVVGIAPVRTKSSVAAVVIIAGIIFLIGALVTWLSPR